MKRSTYILLGALVIMMAVVYLIKRPTAVEESTFAVPDIQVSLNSSTVVKIEIERNKKYLRLERIRNIWKITDPVNYEVDDEAIKQILEGMSHFKITGLVSSNPEKQKVFQVNEEGTTVTFSTPDGKSTALVIGKTDASTGQTYVRPTSSTSVYIAQGLAAPMVNREMRDWRQRTIYRADPSTIQLLSITSESEKYSLRRRGSKWISSERVVPSALVNSALSKLTYLRADDFVDTALIIESRPKLHVEMMGKGLLRMDVYPVRTTLSQYYLKSSASPNIFVVNRSISQEIEKIAEYLAAPPPEVATQPTPTPVEKETRVSPPPTQGQISQPTLQQQITQQITQPPPTQSAGSLENEGELIVYVVRKGDTMQSIAKNYNVTGEQIKKWNILTKETVTPGQELYIFIKSK